MTLTQIPATMRRHASGPPRQKTITFVVTPELDGAIRAACDRSDVSISDLLRHILRQALLEGADVTPAHGVEEAVESSSDRCAAPASLDEANDAAIRIQAELRKTPLGRMVIESSEQVARALDDQARQELLGQMRAGGSGLIDLIAGLFKAAGAVPAGVDGSDEK